ncbi:MAG: fumarylacetoacetate hydrolase family protein [Betaproteobacteria bacterium]|nr:fumarylacetoacetate hydrolase family protein [Betaproteobacteria bacterium]
MIRPALQPLVDALVGAHRRHGRVEARAMPVPANDAEAYAVQEAVAAALGWFDTARAPAWKVGAAGREATPNAAPLPPRGVRTSPAHCAADSFRSIGIEGEIAFRLRSAPVPEAIAHDASALDASIGELVVTIEVVDPRYADVDAAGPALKLADQGLHGALVVGSGVPYREIDWHSQVARVRCDGRIVTETHGGHPLGDLRFLLAWLAGHAAGRGRALAAGDVVTAGTWTGVVEVMPGQTVEVEFPGIGKASARFA